MILGITGGVGSGKSTVLDYLKERYGAYLIECDDVARQLQQPGEECYEPMRELFQDDSLLREDGSFDRIAVARKVFSDEELLGELNRIVHPAVKRRVRELIGTYRKQYAEKNPADGQPLIVIEAALLLEDNYGEICDEIWYIRADDSVRRERLKKSRGYSDGKIEELFVRQRSDESYRECCTLTIDNSSENLQNTFRQLDRALQDRGIS